MLSKYHVENSITNLKYAIMPFLRLRLHGAINRSDSFVLMLSYCVNLKAIRYESTSLNRIVADKSHHVIVALWSFGLLTFNQDLN